MEKAIVPSPSPSPTHNTPPEPPDIWKRDSPGIKTKSMLVSSSVMSWREEGGVAALTTSGTMRSEMTPEEGAASLRKRERERLVL